MSDSGSDDRVASPRDAAEWLSRARGGDFAGAWQASDRILHRHVRRPDWARPRHLQSVWMGEPLDGKRVLVRCYHGLGDTIQFIRYVPCVRARAREVLVWAQPPLIPLLETVDGIDRLMPLHDGTPEVEYDVDVEVMELPYVFRTTLETIPCDVPYLRAPRAVLPGTSPRVGLVWRAGDWELRRSIPFEALRPLLDAPGITWLSLQQDVRASEMRDGLVDVNGRNPAETAERILGLDLLITIDSMPAHLAGALGVPVWTLLQRNADWRWMEERTDSPWYPTMRLFRQTEEGNWADVIERVAEAVTTVRD